MYAVGACRSLYVGDSGDLATAVSVLGIPHPSGYPLYVLLGKLWTLLLFFLPTPWSLSLFSGACASAACGVVYRVAREEGVSTTAGLLSALLLAFSRSFWAEANVPRVYALDALFLALATLFAFRWRRSRRFSRLAAACFLCGLGASNHLSMAVFGVTLAVFAVATEPLLLRRPGRLAACAGLALAGLLPYAYLPLRASAHPLLSWGDARSAGNFFKVILREDFWGRSWVRGARDLGAAAADWAASLGWEMAWVGLVLAIPGVLAARRRRWPVLLPLVAILGNFLSVASHGSRTDIFVWHRYYIPSYLMLAVVAGWGCEVLLERLPRRARIAAFLAPLVLFATGFRANDRSRYRIAEDYSSQILAVLPPGSHVIASDDNILFVLMYLNLGEGRRPDVDLILEGIGGTALPPLAFDPDRDPVFLTHYPNWNVAGLEMVPVGLLFRPWRAGRPWPDPLPVSETLEGEPDPGVPKDYLTQNLIGNFHYMRAVTFETRDWLAARREFALASAAAPRNDVLFYNLGLIYTRNGLFDDALSAFRRSHEINPREIPGSKTAKASERIAELETERDRIRSIEVEVSSSRSLAGLPSGSAAYHREMANLLAAHGELGAAHGHVLRAVELGREDRAAP